MLESEISDQLLFLIGRIQMKSLITLIAMVALTSSAFAHGPSQGRRGWQKPAWKQGHRRPARRLSVTVVRAKKAQALFEALDVETKTVQRPRAVAEIKKVGGLRCAKITRKIDSDKVRYRCALRGKKKPVRALRRAARRDRRQL